MVTLENLKAVMRDGWIAKDKTGIWFWYSHKPELKKDAYGDDEAVWRVGSQAGGEVEWGSLKAFRIDDGGIDWRASCQKVGKI